MDLKGLQIGMNISLPTDVAWGIKFQIFNRNSYKKIIFLNSMEENNLILFETFFMRCFY